MSIHGRPNVKKEKIQSINPKSSNFFTINTYALNAQLFNIFLFYIVFEDVNILTKKLISEILREFQGFTPLTDKHILFTLVRA